MLPRLSRFSRCRRADRARVHLARGRCQRRNRTDRKSTRLNSSHLGISYAVFCLKKTVSLNWVWKGRTAPAAGLSQTSVAPSAWQNIRVPSHAIPQVFGLSPGGQYVFKKIAATPAEFPFPRTPLLSD